LKYNLRQLFSGKENRDLRHLIMGTVKDKRIAGTVKDERIAAKVKMSRPYKGGREMRVWGWIPEQADAYQGSWNRDKVVKRIHKYLDDKYDLDVWREMNSPRDKKTPNNDDPQAFLRSLLEVKEEDNAV